MSEISKKVMGSGRSPPLIEKATASSFDRRTPLLDALSVPQHSPPAFAGVRLAGLLHFTSDLPGFLRAMEASGLDPHRTVMLRKEYPYPAGDEVQRHLETQGYTVLPVSVLENVDVDILFPAGERTLVVEDGGHILSIALRNPQVWGRIVGGVEQTRKGIDRLARAVGVVRDQAADRFDEHLVEALRDLPFPVVTVPTSKLKSRLEPGHIADAVVRALINLTPLQSICHLKIAVLGLGAIGGAIADRLLAEGATVVGYDTNDEAAVLAGNRTCLTVASTVAYAIHGAHVVIGATGATNGRPSVGPVEVPWLRDGVYLVSASSEDVEFDLPALHSAASAVRPLAAGEYAEDPNDATPIGHEFTIGGKRIRVLLDGRPVNFGSFGRLKADIADLVMALVFVAAVDVARVRVAPGIQFGAVDASAQRHRVTATFADLYHHHGARSRSGQVVHGAQNIFVDPRYAEIEEITGPAFANSTNLGIARVRMKPGAASPVHYHRTLEESYVLLEGHGNVLLDGVRHEVGPGHVVSIPPGVRHAIESGSEGLTFLVLTSPPYDPDDDYEEVS